MTVKELKDALEEFPDNFIIMIPDFTTPWCTPAEYVVRGVNEEDGCLFIVGA